MAATILSPTLGIAVPGELMNKSEHALVTELCRLAESSIGKSAHSLLHAKVLGLGGSVRKIAPGADAKRRRSILPKPPKRGEEEPPEPKEAEKSLTPRDRLRKLLA